MNTDQELYSHKPPQIGTVQDLITFFSGIPDDKWCLGMLGDGRGNHCAIGHLGMAFVGRESGYYSTNWGYPEPVIGTDLVGSNNGWPEYVHLGPTPKARVLAYLRSLEPTSAPTQASLILAVTTS